MTCAVTTRLPEVAVTGATAGRCDDALGLAIVLLVDLLLGTTSSFRFFAPVTAVTLTPDTEPGGVPFEKADMVVAEVLTLKRRDGTRFSATASWFTEDTDGGPRDDCDWEEPFGLLAVSEGSKMVLTFCKGRKWDTKHET